MATHIKSILEKFIQEKSKKIDEKGKLDHIIFKHLKKEVKKYIDIKGIYKDRVIIECKRSCLAYEVKLVENVILKDLQKKQIIIEDDNINEAVKEGFISEPIVDEKKNVTTAVKLEKLKSLLPNIKLLNAVGHLNEKKSSGKKYAPRR